MQTMIETLNRTAKIALDDGSSATLDDAIKRFESFKVQIVVGAGVASNTALQAVLLTLINAAPRTFLGGVLVTGETDVQLDLAWFKGKILSQVLPELNGQLSDFSPDLPTIVVGEWIGEIETFCIFVSCDGNKFTVGPERPSPIKKDATIQTGVAAAGVALNEVFHHLYFGRALAGQRNIIGSLPSHGGSQENSSMQDDAWFIGLGHLGQAVLWVLSLSGVSLDKKLQLRLQDYDHITPSSLSTCLMSWEKDMGKLKVDVVGERLSQLGFVCETEANKLIYDDLPKIKEPIDCVVAVDNISFRKGMDKLPSKRIIEAGIGDGINGFTKVQLHVFPGERKAADIWAGGDPKATNIVSINAPAYQDMLHNTKDICGTTQLAGRSIATPFVGAFAGACLFNLWVSDISVQRKQNSWNFDVNTL
ncbi:hypothetical protein MNBD_GAMMA12-1810 [hydrothermal vent metagenome]|uniref:THIF-type NAD/FAD binding fold domain-containing protein n=1 Tax=hydrothermal vent metagenome TaxID=652676 RepID=A0A3B0Y8L3_9ZZZZ